MGWLEIERCTKCSQWKCSFFCDCGFTTQQHDIAARWMEEEIEEADADSEIDSMDVLCDHCGYEGFVGERVEEEIKSDGGMLVKFQVARF